MSTVLDLRRGDPSLLDSLIALGANAAQRCVPGPHKRWASARRISRSRATRQINGDTHSEFTKFLVALTTAGTPWPLIGTALSVILGATMKLMSEELLLERLRRLDDVEHSKEAEENRATVRVSMNPSLAELEAAEKANMAELDVTLERIAVLRELADRKRKA